MHEPVVIRNSGSKWPKVHVAATDLTPGYSVRFACGVSVLVESVAVVSDEVNCRRCLGAIHGKGGHRAR